MRAGQRWGGHDRLHGGFSFIDELGAQMRALSFVEVGGGDQVSFEVRMEPAVDPIAAREFLKISA